MRGITITKQTSVNLSAEQWELYTTSYNCCGAAEAINQAIETAFNQGLTQSEVAAAALKVMHDYRDKGAMDSEPIHKLEDVLAALYQGGC